MPPTLSVLTRNRDFRALFGAELVVFGADWFVMVPLLVLLPELTGSGSWGALVLAVDTGVLALLLPYTGTVADRVDRKRIMVISNLAALGGALALLLTRGPAAGWIAVGAVGAIAVAKAFYSPAASAALPNVVEPEDLASANAISGSAWGTMTVVGASLGGVLSELVSPYTCFVVAAVSLAVAAVLTWGIRRPLQVRGDGAQPAVRAWVAIAESLSYIRRTPRVLALVTVKSAAGLGNGVLTVFPLLAGVFGVGAVGTGGLSYLGVSLAPWFWLVLVLVFVAHFAGGTNWVLSNYALQAEVPDHLRGRVFATDMMLATLAISASQLALLPLVDRVDERVLIAACGSVTLLYAIAWSIATRRLSRAAEEVLSS